MDVSSDPLLSIGTTRGQWLGAARCSPDKVRADRLMGDFVASRPAPCLFVWWVLEQIPVRTLAVVYNRGVRWVSFLPPQLRPWLGVVYGFPGMANYLGFLPPPPSHLGGSLGPPSVGSLSTTKSRWQGTLFVGDDEPDTSTHLNVAERWWRSHQPWLERCGYHLRPRYIQDWIPSWEMTGVLPKLPPPEDAVELPVCFWRSNLGATSRSRPPVL